MDFLSTTQMVLVVIALAVIIGGLYFFYYLRDKKELKKTEAEKPARPEANASTSLQLQAYERLVILAERIALPNLISRLNQPDANKTEMQLLLTNTIRQEFEYNLSQQIYVTGQAWEAIRTLKEQNIHLINQVALILPPDASGQELNRKLLEVIMSQPQGSMHGLVQEALSFEAKKIMQ
ncbi:DUF7935 family protein [Pinibacter aurantiacus]|uniref:Uncharacterized protein n=1 Tax=Pinibacter aurantiacus TaxID=2851599 RepID=A0A9E2SF20_9BACT|nr:hypothetical protein [Pinibacter aurantiacus]MBV4360133.1 hypothetical protein [Pinibacter aurantiacus]